MLRSSEIQNFIPGRAVWNGNSFSTLFRVGFDASKPTVSEWSLNDVLARRKNNIKKLVKIVIHWSIHRIGFHTDIEKMYNSMKLIEEDWYLQWYIWQEDLDPRKLLGRKLSGP